MGFVASVVVAVQPRCPLSDPESLGEGSQLDVRECMEVWFWCLWIDLEAELQVQLIQREIFPWPVDDEPTEEPDGDSHAQEECADPRLVFLRSLKCRVDGIQHERESEAQDKGYDNPAQSR